MDEFTCQYLTHCLYVVLLEHLRGTMNTVLIVHMVNIYITVGSERMTVTRMVRRSGNTDDTSIANAHHRNF